WTAAGLGAVLALILLSRLLVWGRMLRARAAARPRRAAKAVPPVDEDEAAVSALLKEANATLSRAAAYARKHDDSPISSLPLYLLIGPEGSGKSTTFFNSGLEPQLLAGEATGPPPFLSTRLGNFWLAKDALFLEIGGRVFSGDPGRWNRILQSLRTNPAIPAWRRFWSEPQKGFDLRAVIAFCDVKEFTGALTPQGRERLDRQAREWEDRLAAVAAAFGAGFPVYFLITKCDALPYFSDYFRRLTDLEATQVLGCTIPLSSTFDGASSNKTVDGEAKRLTKSFSALYHALAERRIWHLSHEPDLERRTGIYEFPRELRRIRTAVVQFLSTAFRSHPLRPDPQLRGYYFSATGERQASQKLAESGIQEPDSSVALEATALFRADATQIFRPTETKAGPKLVLPPGASQRWLFVSELFHKLVLSDRSLRRQIPPDRQTERKRQIACAAVCTVCLVLCFAFAHSWMRNRELLHSVSESAETQNHFATATIAELQSLENLRVAAGQLLQYEHDGAPLGLRWGLYAGNRVAGAARDLYFRRFQDLLLNPLSAVITAHLQNLPGSPGPDDPYNPVFRLLETHLMISSGVCTPQPALVSEVLKGAVQEIAPTGSGGMWQSLADQQIDFYAGELRYGNPCKLTENTAARDRARQYLAQIRGVERIYGNILATGQKSFAKPQRLGDFSPDYSAVLTGPGEISGIFTRDGWSYVEKMSKKSTGGAEGETCALGESSRFGSVQAQDAGVERAIQRLFIRDYIEHWRQFVTAFSVKGYGSPGDAARKLEILSDHKSPMLALFAMTSTQTNFPQLTAEPAALEKGKAVVRKFLPSLANTSKALGSLPTKTSSAVEPLSTTADITRSFQPVQWIVPPGSDTWVTDKNGAYIDALAQLGHSMRDIEGSGASPDPAIFQAASQNYDKALDAARQLARGFEPLGVGGLDTAMERLLEAPIRQSQRFIIRDIDSATAGKVNGQLHAVCVRVRNTLRKYPFSLSGEDASLEDVASLFGPGSGVIWKFQTECLGDFVVKDAGRWKSKDPAKKPQVTQEMLTFLNRAQALADAFYPAGASQPRFTYTLRPKLDSSYKDAVLELEIDGQVHAWTSSLQKQFRWPSALPGSNTGVIGRIKMGSLSFPFTSRGGTWGIFRVMSDAEPRSLDSKLIEWKYVRGGDGRLEEIQPAPVRLEIVEFPGGADLFNPKFFQGLQCPAKAIQ
ncbi:MAG: type VI secretion system membrane subunit TssM, partial [Acidobacteriaceae bacterium]|nr:type VI secretion system membrane subunit TssM [Acidobacteriaceae bacterium]